ncbi:MAG TPA: prepilin-type N-terminal cleavage/methylation domain-containing protein [Armatimonadota bacterium]|jgi:prepilin-type N-terminal cleavage/methylation domain-containing protein|nr:prepilin-type N-terminal cleavage/methylation domain-containing protein [Armatimonadota bacterium]
MRNLRNSKGFTLIELMIVVVIIGILAAIAIPKFSEVSNRAKNSEAQPIMKQICTLAGTVIAETGNAPANVAALAPYGWRAPAAKHFTGFEIAGNVVTATAGSTGATTQTMTCDFTA